MLPYSHHYCLVTGIILIYITPTKEAERLNWGVGSMCFSENGNLALDIFPK
jgi:hypothetical protein